ncbi:MAG: hypothetical protein AAFP26_11035, partial [Planctomycetota bacterium]
MLVVAARHQVARSVALEHLAPYRAHQAHAGFELALHLGRISAREDLVEPEHVAPNVAAAAHQNARFEIALEPLGLGAGEAIVFEHLAPDGVEAVGVGLEPATQPVDLAHHFLVELEDLRVEGAHPARIQLDSSEGFPVELEDIPPHRTGTSGIICTLNRGPTMSHVMDIFYTRNTMTP